MSEFSLVKKGIELKPDKADLYNWLGDGSRSLDYARRGQALAAETAGRR